MRKVSVVVASRANYGRSQSILRAIQDHPNLELDLILAASALLYRYGDIEALVMKHGFDISHKIFSVVEGENHVSMVKSTSMLLSDLGSYLSNSAPNVVLTIADRHETLATAIAASYLNIPLAHTQGGEVTGSIDDSVRHSITKLANIHFPATKKAALNLLRLGEDPSSIYFTGCPAIDIANSINKSVEQISSPHLGSGCPIDFRHDYGIILFHPNTQSPDEIHPVLYRLFRIVSSSHIPFIWLWPNVDAGSDIISKLLRQQRNEDVFFSQKVRFVRSYSPEDYIRVLANARVLIGNSSSFIREASFLAVPSLIIGDRQRQRELGRNALRFSYQEFLSLPDSLSDLLDMLPDPNNLAQDNLYGHGTAGQQIANLLATIHLATVKPPL